MGITSKFDQHLSGCSILLWKINLLKQSLHVSMHAGWADFPHDIAKMMKNPDYRKSLVKNDDLASLNAALADIRKGRDAKVVFRIVTCDDLTHWCLLVGNAQEGGAESVFGSLICIDNRYIARSSYGRVLGNGFATGTQRETEAGAFKRRLEGLRRKLSPLGGLHERLSALCEWDSDDVYEAVLFSDVKITSGQVEVHKAGEAFSALPQGKSYPYEGTVAEMMVSLNLDYVVVDDTMESLKPIDWALFVPNGIRSYFAVPTFQDGVLCGVLIFCSTNANEFNEEQELYFSQIADVLFSLHDT